MMDFREGDIVRIKSGSCDMTVINEKPSQTEVTVIYYANGIISKVHISKAALVMVQGRG